MTGRWVGYRVGLDPVENKNTAVTPIPQASNPYNLFKLPGISWFLFCHFSPLEMNYTILELGEL